MPPRLAAPLLLLGLACGLRSPLSVASVDGLTISHTGRGRAALEIALRVRADTRLDAEVTVLSYQIALGEEDRPLGGGGRLPPLSVPAGAEVALVLPAQIDLRALPPGLPALAARGAIPFRAELSLEAKTRFGRTERALVLEGEAPLGPTFEALLEGAFGPDELRLVGLGPVELKNGILRLGFAVELPGYLPFPLVVTGASYELSLGGAYLGRGSSKEGFRIEPERGGVGRFQLEAPVLGLPFALSALSGGATTVEIHGALEIEPIGPIRRIPFRVEAPLP